MRGLARSTADAEALVGPAHDDAAGSRPHATFARALPARELNPCSIPITWVPGTRAAASALGRLWVSAQLKQRAAYTTKSYWDELAKSRVGEVSDKPSVASARAQRSWRKRGSPAPRPAHSVAWPGASICERSRTDSRHFLFEGSRRIARCADLRRPTARTPVRCAPKRAAAWPTPPPEPIMCRASSPSTVRWDSPEAQNKRSVSPEPAQCLCSTGVQYQRSTNVVPVRHPCRTSMVPALHQRSTSGSQGGVPAWCQWPTSAVLVQ